MSVHLADSTAALKTWRQRIRRELGRLIRQAETLAMRPAALSTERQFLFVLAHMRSGSSLLRYLLCGSDEIIGVGESHNNYRRRSDLAKLLTFIRRSSGKNPLRYRYIMDKIVASQHVLSAAVLTDPRTRYVFLVREPQATVNSIVAARRQLHDETTDELVAYATTYYIERLAQLVHYADSINDEKRCLLVTYQQLVGQTPSAFGALEHFLDLRGPLREQYEPVAAAPGPVRWVSPKINVGSIDRSPPRHKQIVLPAVQRAFLDDVFEATLEKLHCRMSSVDTTAAPTVRLAA